MIGFLFVNEWVSLAAYFIVALVIFALSFTVVSRRPVLNSITFIALLFIILGIFYSTVPMFFLYHGTILSGALVMVSLFVFSGLLNSYESVQRRAKFIWLIPAWTFVGLAFEYGMEPVYYALASALFLWLFFMSIEIIFTKLKEVVIFLRELRSCEGSVWKKEWAYFLSTFTFLNLLVYFWIILQFRHAGESGLIIIFAPYMAVISYVIIMVIIALTAGALKLLIYINKSRALSSFKQFLISLLFLNLVALAAVYMKIEFYDNWLELLFASATFYVPFFAISLIISEIFTRIKLKKCNISKTGSSVLKSSAWALVFFPIIFAALLGSLRYISEHAIICHVGLDQYTRETCIYGKELRRGKIDPEVQDKKWQELLLASANGTVEDCKKFRHYSMDIDYYGMPKVYYNGEAFCRASLIVSGRAEADICNGLMESLSQNCRDLVKELKNEMLGVETDRAIKESELDKIISYVSLENYPRGNMVFINALFRQ